MHSNEFNDFKSFQINSNLFLSKQDLPELEKIEIKYSFEVFDERNNFLHRNVFIFEMGFELKLKFLSKIESKEDRHLGNLRSLL
jgi:hypothetical protein